MRLLRLFHYLSAIAVALSQSAFAATVPAIGNQYFVFDLGTFNTELPTGPSNNWYLPGQNFKTPVAFRHFNPGLVDQHIDNMRASGIDTLALQLPLGNIGACEASGACNDGVSDGVWGEVLDYSNYSLRAQHQTNLINIIHRAKIDKFRYIIVRFGNYAPSGWGAWNETEYQMAWNLVVSTRSLVYSELSGSPVKVLFDLGPEMIGDSSGQNQAYFQRLWSDYVYSFGNSDTVGASMIGDPFFLAGLSWYGSVKPPIYAFDIYQFGSTGVGQALVNMWNGLGAVEKAKPVILMETYHNDSTTASQIQVALASNPGLNLMAVIPWPTTRDPVCSGCQGHVRNSAIQALSATTQVSNYLGIASKFVSDDSISSLLNFTDVSCVSGSYPCTIRGNFSSNPNSKFANYKIFIRNFTNPNDRTLWVCNAGNTTADANWIQKNDTYYFEYYSVATCSSPIGVNPAATSIVTVR